MVSQLIIAVWWASSINTKMAMMLVLAQDFGKINNTLKEYSTKVEVATALATAEREMATALGFANKELAAMWKRIDSIKGIRDGT